MVQCLTIRSATIVAGLAMVHAAFADVDYEVTPHPDQKKLSVVMSFPVSGTQTDLMIPNWSPGLYILQENWRGVDSFHVKNESGSELQVSKPNNYTWRVTSGGAKRLTVTYDIAAGRTRPMGPQSEIGATCIHYGGASTYLNIRDRKAEPCRLDIKAPTGWRVAIGLLPDKSGHKYRAKNYDVLCDNSVTMGDFIEDRYTVRGKGHVIAIRNEAKSKVDRARLLKIASFISEMEGDFFGGLPYDTYVWHVGAIDAPTGGYGLEHLTSTEIAVPAALGPGTASLFAHEYFHLWNVKRIRSSVLGPFDYTKLPQTGAFWWLEGVTDYYTYHLLHRYGWEGDSAFYSDIAENVNDVRANKSRFEVSPYDSSFRVNEASSGRGNSNGYGVSYYNTGWVLGMLLDIEIRSQTHGKRSLDDVELALWKQCQNDQPGFPEDGIRKQLVAVGGEPLGEFYDKYVMRAGELPVEQQLAKVGLRFADQTVETKSLGFSWSPTAVVRQVSPEIKGLQQGDVLVEIDGKPLANAGSLAFAQSKSKPGELVHLKVVRKAQGQPDQTLEVDVNPTAKMTTTRVVEEDPQATRDQIKLREGWFWGPRKRPATIVGP